MENLHVVIMAGGDGKRLWPISNQETPKQFVDLLGCGRTLIQLTYDRLKNVCPDRNFWIVTSEEYSDIVSEQMPQVRKDHILLEPMCKNTAVAMAYFTWKIKSVAPDAMVVVTNSDQMVTNYDYFTDVINKSVNFAQTECALVAVGIKPTRDEVHGFFEVDQNAVNGNIYKVKRYMGRPNISEVAEYMGNVNAYWNTSILIAPVQVIEQSFRRYANCISDAFDELTPVLFSAREKYVLGEVMRKIDGSKSYERMVLRYAENLYLFCADMGWSDLGKWNDLLPFVSMARYGSLKVGNVKAYDCSNCIIELPDAKEAVIEGLNGYVVAMKDGALLICRMENVQNMMPQTPESKSL